MPYAQTPLYLPSAATTIPSSLPRPSLHHSMTCCVGVKSQRRFGRASNQLNLASFECVRHVKCAETAPREKGQTELRWERVKSSGGSGAAGGVTHLWVSVTGNTPAAVAGCHQFEFVCRWVSSPKPPLPLPSPLTLTSPSCSCFSHWFRADFALMQTQKKNEFHQIHQRVEIATFNAKYPKKKKRKKGEEVGQRLKGGAWWCWMRIWCRRWWRCHPSLPLLRDTNASETEPGYGKRGEEGKGALKVDAA